MPIELMQRKLVNRKEFLYLNLSTDMDKIKY